MIESSVIDVEFTPVVDAAMVGARLTDVVVIREIHPTILASTAPVPAPHPRDDYVEFLKSLALSMAKKAVLELLIPQLPKILTTGFLGSIFSPLIGFLVGKILEIAIRETEVGLFFLFIDLRTSEQGRDFEKAAKQNLEKQRTGTPEEADRARRDLINAFRTLVKFTS